MSNNMHSSAVGKVKSCKTSNLAALFQTLMQEETYGKEQMQLGMSRIKAAQITPIYFPIKREAPKSLPDCFKTKEVPVLSWQDIPSCF